MAPHPEVKEGIAGKKLFLVGYLKKKKNCGGKGGGADLEEIRMEISPKYTA